MCWTFEWSKVLNCHWSSSLCSKCFLWLLKLWPSRKFNRSSVTYQIKWEALEDKKVTKKLGSSTSYKFRQLPDASEDIVKEWLMFRSAIISSAAENCGRKRLLRMARDSEKRTTWGNQKVKEAIRAKKDALKTSLHDRWSSDLQSRYTEAWKAATLAVKSKKSWEKLGCRSNFNYSSAI